MNTGTSSLRTIVTELSKKQNSMVKKKETMMDDTLPMEVGI